MCKWCTRFVFSWFIIKTVILMVYESDSVWDIKVKKEIIMKLVVHKLVLNLRRSANTTYFTFLTFGIQTLVAYEIVKE